ncbi:hypothetical protein ACHQM5_012278 [Ranunculus cassubicifolius]
MLATYFRHPFLYSSVFAGTFFVCEYLMIGEYFTDILDERREQRKLSKEQRKLSNEQRKVRERQLQYQRLDEQVNQLQYEVNKLMYKATLLKKKLDKSQ